MNIEKRIQKFDEEDKIWLEKTKGEVEKRNLEKDDLFPFKVPQGSNTLLANPNFLKHCFTPLLSLYDTIFYYFPPGMSLEDSIGITQSELIELSEEKRAIPIFYPKIDEYSNEIQEFVLEYSAPYLTSNNMIALRYYFCLENNLLDEAEYFKSLELLPELSKKNWVCINEKDIQDEEKFMVYLQDKEKWTMFTAHEIGLMSKVVHASNRNIFIDSIALNSTLQHFDFLLNLSNKLNKLSGFVKPHDFNLLDGLTDLDDFNLNEYDLEYIVRNLKIAYTPDMDLKEYLNIFDNNTTRKIRGIMKDIIDFRADSNDFLELKKRICIAGSPS